MKKAVQEYKNKGFYIWFNASKKEEYYLTPFYNIGNLTQVQSYSNNKYKVTLNRNNNSISDYKLKDSEIQKTPFVVLTPYSEKLGTFLMHFLNADFSSFERAFDTFYCYYGTEFLYDIYSKQLKMKYANEFLLYDKLKSLHNANLDTFTQIQDIFRKLVDFLYNLHGNTEYDNYSASEKFTACVLKNNMNILDYTRDTSIFNLTFDEKAEKFKNSSFNDILKNLDIYSSLIFVSNVYTSNSLGDICFVVLNQILQNKLTIRTCQNCGKYYIPNKLNEIYCDFIQDDGTTCRAKGAGETYKKTLENIPGLLEYRRIYNRKSNIISRNPDNITAKNEFEKWKKIAQTKVKEYKQDKITEDELYEWMIENN